MTRRCELTAISTATGCNVSHSHRRTNRVYRPNLHVVSFYSQVLKTAVRFRVASAAIRSVDKHGGIDEFLTKYDDKNFSKKVLSTKKLIQKKLLEQ